MTNVDQFESVFKAAAKTAFDYETPALARILIVSDVDGEEAGSFESDAQRFFENASIASDVHWQAVRGGDYSSVPELLELVEQKRPDLICTYRNLHSEAWRWPYSLGEYIDLLTQVTTIPVLLLRHPQTSQAEETGPEPSQTPRHSVMALTDHLTGDSRLVATAAALTRPSGTLHLAHIEDERVFDYYLEAISKIPTIDTDSAREEILGQLLKEPLDYIGSCRRGLAEAGLSVDVRSHVQLGHRLSDCTNLVEKHHVDLLVFNTKDAEQLAMHGLAYPLAIEMRHLPLLML